MCVSVERGRIHHTLIHILIQNNVLGLPFICCDLSSFFAVASFCKKKTKKTCPNYGQLYHALWAAKLEIFFFCVPYGQRNQPLLE